MKDKIKKARELYNKSPFDIKACEEQIAFTNNEDHIILKAYFATATIVGTKYINNPFKRIAPFKLGKEMLEELISENFDEIELRFMRYSIQRQAPKMLGYYRNIEMDKKTLVNYIKLNPTSELTTHMMVYLTDTKDEILGLI